MIHDPEFDFLGDRVIENLKKRREDLQKQPKTGERDRLIASIDQQLQEWRADN